MKHIKQFDTFVNEELSTQDLNDLEKYADDMFNELGIDVVFTRHFKDRVNDVRNSQPITYSELKNLFLKANLRAGRQISELPAETEAVLKDLHTKINAPFKIQDAPEDGDHPPHNMIMKTIMKKDRFMSPNRTISV